MDMIYVVVPVYKVEPYLHRCIDSILNQTHSDFTLILVDDGSPDNCGAICDEYAKKDSRIHVIHQENGGVSVARNTGVTYVLEHGDPEKDWLNFIDSDDFVHPKYLEYLYRAAKEANTDLSSCHYCETTHSQISCLDSNTLQYARYGVEDYLCGHHTKSILAWAKLYRLFLFRDIRYPIGRIHEDQFTTHQIIFQCEHIAVIPQVLYHYYQNENSIMHSSWSPRALDELDALSAQKAYFLQHGFLRAYEKAFSVYLKQCASKLRGMKLAHRPISERKGLALRFYRDLLLYGKEFGFRKAFQLWFRVRVLRWFKRVFSITFLRRIVAKLTRIAKGS